MFARMTIRSGLLLVTGLFCLALWSVLFAAWRDARASARALEQVIGVSDRQLEPLHDTERLLLAMLVDMDSAYINLQRGDQVRANDYTHRATARRMQAEKTYAAYRKAASADPGQAAWLARIGQAYDAYAKVLDTREEALYDVSLDAYAAGGPAAEQADMAFDAALRDVIAHAQAVRAGLSAASAQRRARAAALAAAMFTLSLLLAGACWLFFRRFLLLPLRRTGGHFDRIADGDLTVSPQAASANEIGTLLAALRRMQDGLAQAVGAIRRGADEVSHGAHGIAHGNGALAARTEQQASALEESASTLEQLSSAVRQNAEHAAQARALAESAASDAERGGRLVTRAVQTMNEVSGSARHIADIVGVIDGIAFQTNLLALNAAVEAARAGVQGRGFAVVAGEVRALSQRSAEAAQEVKRLIGASVAHAARGATEVEEAGGAMADIVRSAQRVTANINDIAQATAEQASGIEQVSAAVAEMERATQQNGALVEQTALAAEALSTQAERLVQAVSVFRLPPRQHADPVALPR